jgi:dolichol-phosphate mannosyltransferase
MRTAIVIPTYNERENLSALVDELLETTDAEIRVVDDDSPDGTGEVADGLARRLERVQVLHRPHKDGVGRAYVAGFQRALDEGFDRIVQMDADFSHQPRYLPELLAALDHAEVAIGSRYVSGGGVETWGLLRRGVSGLGNTWARRALGMPYRDLTSGFGAFRRHVLEAVDLPSMHSEGYSFQIELKYRAHRLGFTIAEVPIVFFDRVVGQSKINKKTIPEALLRVAQMRLTGEP